MPVIKSKLKTDTALYRKLFSDVLTRQSIEF